MENNKHDKIIKQKLVSDRSQSYLGTQCIVCGESVPLNYYETKKVLSGEYIQGKICDECKKAIMYMRSQMNKK